MNDLCQNIFKFYIIDLHIGMILDCPFEDEE